jgi:hypothetical protein
MKTKKPSVFEILILCVIAAVLIALLLPALTRSRPRSGAPSVLWQVYVASYMYQDNHRQLPSSLRDLIGMAIFKSGAERTVFSKEQAEKELGTNIEAVVYLPQFMALGDLTTNVLLAYVPDIKNPNFSYAVYGGAKIERVPSSEIAKQVEHLKILLGDKNSTNSTTTQPHL